MTTGWLRRLTARGCAAILLSFIVGCGSSSALGGAGDGINPESMVLPVGVSYYVGWVGFSVSGQHSVHVLSVTVLGVPDGLKVKGVYAVSMKESDNPGQEGHYIGGADELALKVDYPRLRLHPPSDAVFPPGSKPHDWYILVALTPTRPGTFTTGGLRVDYEADGQTGSQTYPDQVTVHCALGATLGPLSSPRSTPTVAG